MKCSACGADIEEDAKFCIKCGAPVVRHEEIAGGESSSLVRGETKEPSEDKTKEAESKIGEVKEEKPEEVIVEKREGVKEPELVDKTAEKIEKTIVGQEKDKASPRISETQVSQPDKVKKTHTGAIIATIVIVFFIVVGGLGFYFLHYLPSQYIYKSDFQYLDKEEWGILESGQNFIVKTQDGSLFLRNGAIYLKRNVGSDYTVECEIYIVGVSDKNGYGGIIFRGGSGGMYILKICPDVDMITLIKQPGGVISSKGVNIGKGKWYSISIKVEGENIFCYINEKKIIGVRDVGFAKGGVGFKVDDATVLFRDFIVR
ncbi:MAG: zinc-ribbon domain-containing protein [bacterium]